MVEENGVFMVQVTPPRGKVSDTRRKFQDPELEDFVRKHHDRVAEINVLLDREYPFDRERFELMLGSESPALSAGEL